ncbi:MAG: methylamine utilization protein [Sphingomonadaceae bacterium]|nr:methylamine utilization protein [Sphingomonadaceae bacterium]
MRALVATLLALLLAAAPAWAGDLVVQVRGPNGAPVPNAVVTLYPGGRPSPLGPAGGSYQIAQRDLQFSPFVLVVPVGADVSFPNFDNVRHHVYSFSPVRRFELRLYAREQARSVHFDRPGIVPLGCNIHDNMIAFIDVVDTAFAARTDGAGQAHFTAIPGGQLLVRVWHPYLRAPANQLELSLAVPDHGIVTRPVPVNLRPPPRPGNAY